MKIKNNSKTELVIQEIGSRLTKKRTEASLTQAALALKADVSKRTIERIESGSSIQLSTLIQVLRVFDMLEALELVLEERSSATKLDKTTKSVNRVGLKEDPEPRVNKSRSWGYDS